MHGKCCGVPYASNGCRRYGKGFYIWIILCLRPCSHLVPEHWCPSTGTKCGYVQTLGAQNVRMFTFNKPSTCSLYANRGDRNMHTRSRPCTRASARAKNRARALEKKCVHISAQQESYSGTSARAPSVNKA